ncbi:MAG: DUF4149 domain-containing protein [Cyanobacteria bacterium P01_D01_bin.73]
MKRLELGQEAIGELEGVGRSQFLFEPGTWKVITGLVLALWLGGSLVLDLVVMPSLYWAGMMAKPDFMDAGALLFGIFNRVELLLAGVTLSGLLAVAYLQKISPKLQRWLITLGAVLLAIVIVDTYGLTPSMVSLGAPLSWPTLLSDLPTGMNQLHGAYFALETVKLSIGALVLGLCIGHPDRTYSSVS